MALITKNEPRLKFGDPAPDFSLPNVDGTAASLDSFKEKRLLAVIFTCNHCPYAQAYEDRIITLQREYQEKGVQLVLICSNDAKNYPEDSFENMKMRAREKRYPFPYLRDETQRVAKAYDAACTPEIYLFDDQRRLCFHGRLDDNYEEPKKAKKHYFRDAIEDLLAGREVRTPESHPIGCSIKWV